MHVTHLVRLALALSGLLLVATWPVALAQDDDGPMADSELTQGVQPVEIVATDFEFAPKTITVPSGPVTLMLRNQGVIDHNLAIENSRRDVLGNSPLAPSRGSAYLDITLPEGTYTMVCTLPAHREAGMTGTVTVTAS